MDAGRVSKLFLPGIAIRVSVNGEFWFTFNRDKPTVEDFALKWPKEKMAVSYRTLRDDEEAQCLYGEKPRIFTVM